MAFNLEEQEKISAIKAWWDKWSNLITIAVVLVVVAFFAHTGWKWYQAQHAENALAYYDEIVNASGDISEENTARIKVSIDKLRESYSSTAYASRAIMIASDYFYKANRLDLAKDNLSWLIAQTSEFPEFTDIARLRLSTIQIEQGEYEAAQNNLNAIKDEKAQAMVKDKLADLAFAQGEVQKAVDMWRSIIQDEHLTLSPGFRNYIVFKISTLGKSKE
ncbi:YfgM family protein [Basilea psittacipulmonis]|uniref:Ancillary SecYEG translocon subunit n=1 Tax=Basilea psittacipulmonis DSM 24701 TaxID=1072685 RepID=A0A077DGS8_9BURK|nr:tetratricopeptide repeat protein [Basilea psittacipulmonis]AIL32662.1 hypothetical protein IX83_04485 [Basilea psittacipulmonis DSM 24701]